MLIDIAKKLTRESFLQVKGKVENNLDPIKMSMLHVLFYFSFL